MKMHTPYSDTPDEVDQHRLKLIAGLSPEERFSRMNRLCAFGTMAMLEGLREKNPRHTEKELRLLLAYHLHGSSFAQYIKSRI
jgi:hypothetical protein